MKAKIRLWSCKSLRVLTMVMKALEWLYTSPGSQRHKTTIKGTDVVVITVEQLVEELEIAIIHMRASLILAKREIKGTSSGSKAKVVKNIRRWRSRLSSAEITKARQLIPYQQKCRSLRSLYPMKSHLALLAL